MSDDNINLYQYFDGEAWMSAAKQKALMRDILSNIEWRPTGDITKGGIEAECHTEYGTFCLAVRPNMVWRHSLVGYVFLRIPGQDQDHRVAAHYFTHLESVVNQIYNTISDTIIVMDRLSTMTATEMADEANQVVWRKI